MSFGYQVLGFGAFPSRGAAAYVISQSARFNDDDTAFLSRTPRVAGNRRTWTFSCWAKRSETGTTGPFFSAGATGTSDENHFNFYINSDQMWVTGATNYLKTTQVFRDSSAWMHVLLAVDTTHATADSRIRLYVNGAEVTAFGTRNNPTQNLEMPVNNVGEIQNVGKNAAGSVYFDGYLSDVHLIDGLQLAPTSFGETDDYGNWIPKEYSYTAVSDATVTYIGVTHKTGNAADFAFASTAIGTDTANRMVVVGMYSDGISAGEIDEVKINSVAAIQLDGGPEGDIHSNTYGNLEFWGLTGVSGTSVTIDVNHTGTKTGCSIAVWDVKGAQTSGLFDRNSDNGTAAVHDLTCTMPEGGVSMAIGFTQGSSESFAWTGGISEDFDEAGTGATSFFTGASDDSASDSDYAALQNNLPIVMTVVSDNVHEWSNIISLAPANGIHNSGYGTNGFRLDFAVNSHFGKDVKENIARTTRQDFLQDLTDADALTNLHMLLDAADSASTDGSSQTWTDVSAAGASDMFRGSAVGVSASEDPDFLGVAGDLKRSTFWNIDGSTEYFTEVNSPGSEEDSWHQNGALFTMGIWMRLVAATGADVIINTLNSSGLHGLTWRADASKIYIEAVHGSGNAMSKATDGSPPPVGEWAFVAVSINEATGSGGGFHYLNGNYNQVSSADTFDATYTSPSTTAVDGVGIGAYGQGNAGTFISADIAGVFIWQRALTKANLDAVYNATKHRFSEFEDSGLATNDQTKDSPTDDVDNNVGNYATLNVLDTRAGPTLSQGNTALANGSKYAPAQSTIPFPITGKWGCLITVTTFGSACRAGLASFNASEWNNDGTHVSQRPTNPDCLIAQNGDQQLDKVYGATLENLNAAGADMSDGDTIEFLIDRDAATCEVKVEGVSLGTASSLPAVELFLYVNSYGGLLNVDFGQHGYTPTEAGFNFLHTAKLSAPTILDPSKYFQVDTFTGTGAEEVRTLTDAAGEAVSPDLVWMKDRDTAIRWGAIDSVRGATKEISLETGTDIENTVAQSLKSFNASGYTLGTDSAWNASSSPQVAYCWVEEATIFDAMTYTGNFAVRTISHGMSVVPQMLIVKDTTSGSDVQHWQLYHGKTEVGDPETDYFLVSGTNVRGDGLAWNDTAPTSSVFTVGEIDSTNKADQTYLAWMWAGVGGYSKFGHYEGNGNANGTFVWLGFRPALVIIKSVDSTSAWHVYDYKRDGYNVDNDRLELNTTAAETTGDEIDFLSNGFKCRIATDPNVAETYIYAAWAERPFGGSGLNQARAK